MKFNVVQKVQVLVEAVQHVCINFDDAPRSAEVEKEQDVIRKRIERMCDELRPYTPKVLTLLRKLPSDRRGHKDYLLWLFERSEKHKQTWRL